MLHCDSLHLCSFSLTDFWGFCDCTYRVLLHFDEYLPNVRNYSPNTIASYQDTFRLLLEYMAEQQHIKPYLLDYKHFSDKVILSFLNWLETHRNCSPSTRNQRLSAISAFFKYASQRSISALKICSNIASIPPKKTPRHIFSYFSVEELRVLLQMPDPRKPLERRDIVLLSLLYDSGARAQELCGIRVGDIRFSNPASVLLHGKGGKSRVVPLMNRPTRILQQFIAERKFGTAEKDAPLFLNQRGEPITPACIRNVICKYISRAKNIRPDLFNESSYSPHSFRHSKAVHLLEAGTELVYIRDFLGHVSVQTTEIYATVSQSMLNSVLRNRSIPKVLNVDLNEISHDAIPDYLRKKK
ncbi:MAG: tyrosine-type recombinase/integrase [Oscillospiraceae bacterium]